MMNSKFRPLFLLLGFAGLFVLLFQLVANIQNLDLIMVIAIAVPDMFFFYLAYLTYPPDAEPNRYESF